MIESPLIQELIADKLQRAIVAVLEGRYRTVPPEAASALRAVTDEQQLMELLRLAGRCSDLESFQSHLTA